MQGNKLSQEQKKIVLIEDDSRQQQLVATFLRSEGFEVISSERGDQAPELIAKHSPDAVLLDLMLPGMDGIQVCQVVRDFYSGPILMVTAQGDDVTEVSALNLGVDDFLSKPLRPHVLLARLRSALRRSERASTIDALQMSNSEPVRHPNRIICQELTADKTQRRIWLSEQLLELTDAEFDLLYFLMDNAGHVLPRDVLFKEMRGIDYDGLDRSLDMRVSTIRKKLNDNTPPYRYIKSVRGKGYLFVKAA
ncbi:response regulator transcription factor [Agarivorans sp. Alg241-V36]|uniref:response regulator transcription factor n=1 Tax=Agarivorans sp. Alg241-V36 TaxID=2305992 RepID=UPI0013D082E1|nr:response regulator transcription factor [Agarivorans sp. Alg241-V36]